MNIEIANRLVELRKKSGLSQEDLASKLGLSRQAVSKWERAEASPDTDNLICLAKLYGVSLDDLLNTEESVDDIAREMKEKTSETSKEEAPKEEAPKDDASKEEAKSEETKEEKSDESEKGHDYFHMGSDGIHFGSDDGDKGSIDSKGIHVVSGDGSYVHIDESGIHIKDKDGDEVNHGCNYKSSFVDNNSKRNKRFALAEAWVGGLSALLCTIAYILLGCLYPDPYVGWGICWLVFLLIPLASSFVTALKHRRFCDFAYPVLVSGVFVFIGMYLHLWHPEWVMFLSIPVYYIVFGPIDKLVAEKRFKEGKNHIHINLNGNDNDKDEDKVIDVDVK